MAISLAVALIVANGGIANIKENAADAFSEAINPTYNDMTSHAMVAECLGVVQNPYTHMLGRAFGVEDAMKFGTYVERLAERKVGQEFVSACSHAAQIRWRQSDDFQRPIRDALRGVLEKFKYILEQ